MASRILAITDKNVCHSMNLMKCRYIQIQPTEFFANQSINFVSFKPFLTNL